MRNVLINHLSTSLTDLVPVPGKINFVQSLIVARIYNFFQTIIIIVLQDLSGLKLKKILEFLIVSSTVFFP